MTQSNAEHEAEPPEDVDELAAQLDVLREENDRLRENYARAKKATYRRTSAALIGVGTAALVSGIVLPSLRQLLIVIAAIGIFAGILTFYLTPERVVSVDVSESIYDAHHAVSAQLVDELGLTDNRIYAPIESNIRLFIPAHRDCTLPTDNDLFVTDTDATRGVTLRPTGAMLATELETTTSPSSGEFSFPSVIRQAGDAVVEQFEIADSVDIVADASDVENQVVVEISGAAFGRLSKLDHPVVSLIGTAAASELNIPVSVDTVHQSESFTVTYTRLDKSTDSDSESSTADSLLGSTQTNSPATHR